MFIVGIFGAWDLNFIEQTEAKFAKALKRNPIYPFECDKSEPKVLKCHMKSAKFLFSIVVALFTAGFCAIFYQYNDIDQYFALPVVAIVVSLFSAAVHRGRCLLIVDGNKMQYEFYRRGHMVYHGHHHNIYIRVKATKSAGGDTYYEVILGGYNVDEMPLSAQSTHHERLQRLAKRLAANLNLNYFSIQDKSKDHVIRHRCPYIKNQKGSYVTEPDYPNPNKSGDLLASSYDTEFSSWTPPS